MALFKIYKGQDSKALIDPAYENYIPWHDGYCYFDTQTGLFYIDAEKVDLETKEILQVRAPINGARAFFDGQDNRIDTTYLKISDYAPFVISYGVCETESIILRKEVVISEFTGAIDTLFLVKFINDVPANSILSINNENDFNIKINETAIPDSLIRGGTTVLFRINEKNEAEILNIDKNILLKANIESPSFTGTPTAPTPNENDNSKSIATTEFIKNQINKIIDSASEKYNTLGKIENQLKEDIKDGTLTIMQGDKQLGIFSANSSENKTIIIEEPTNKTLTILSENDTLGTFSANSQEDVVINVPSPKDGILTINRNNHNIGSFSANAEDDVSINIEIPTDLGDLTNMPGFYNPDNLKEATTDKAGLLSASDKNKLNGIENGANRYIHPLFTPFSLGLYKISTNENGHVTNTSLANKEDILSLVGYTPAKDEHTHMYAGSAEIGGPANSVANALSFTVGGESKGSYDGSTPHTIDINAYDLNISGALSYIGRTNIDPETLLPPDNTTITLVSGQVVAVSPGNVIIYTNGNIEYLYDNDGNWIKLGSASDFSLQVHIHGNIDNHGYLTNSDGIAQAHRLVISNGTGLIDSGVSLSTTETSKFLNENGNWKEISWDTLIGRPTEFPVGAHTHNAADINSGALSPAFGGTGKNNLKDATNAFISSLDINSSSPNLTDYIVTQKSAGNISERYSIESLWGVLKNNANELYVKITGDTMTGNLTAPMFRGVASSLYMGDDAPTDESVSVWIDTSESADAVSNIAAKLQESRTIDGISFDGTDNVSHYGVCSTTAAAAAKIVNCNLFKLVTGARIIVKFTITNTAANPTLNVNNTGAKPIFYKGAAISTSYLAANKIYEFVYDGVNYNLIGDVDTNTTYWNTNVICTTAAATAAKVGSCSFYNLSSNRYITVMLRYANSVAGAITLNINSQGAKPIYINGYASSDSNYTLPAGTYLVYYDGTNYHFRTDQYIQGNLIGNASSASALNCRATTTDTKYYLLGATGTGNQNVYRALNSAGSANTTGCYFNGASGVLYGAAWNDYAEFRELKENINNIPYGRVVVENGDDTLSLSTTRLQLGGSIVSDTFGFSIGETEKAKMPIAVAGRVLAYPAEDKNTYIPGAAVCSGPNGTVSMMTREEIREWPDAIIGYFSAVPDYKIWGPSNVKVDGRIWIKIK